ncbi:hypothetical protein PPACK8108_LOCUS26218 [Phakopsora pachyrhizi]|uniref:Uncharacterized protein n=1 Tax=Phakopsora pachyrhizi TaxID=170000 RepID=A0AAV0BU74_PHAPC|nr:hypothetical protein PPACK8108_LOCUS26218 [Phakopsora pachyrhizi]
MVLEATFYASVLHLCGSRPISQPMSSNRSDSLFLWNKVSANLLSYVQVEGKEALRVTEVDFLMDQMTKRIQKDSEKSSADNHDSNTTFDVPDRQTGERSWRELSKLTPGRDWRFVRVDVRMAEYLEHKEKIIKLMRPNLTVMDLVSCL